MNTDGILFQILLRIAGPLGTLIGLIIVIWVINIVDKRRKS